MNQALYAHMNNKRKMEKKKKLTAPSKENHVTFPANLGKWQPKEKPNILTWQSEAPRTPKPTVLKKDSKSAKAEILSLVFL
jgi:hypothetical protein